MKEPTSVVIYTGGGTPPLITAPPIRPLASARIGHGQSNIIFGSGATRSHPDCVEEDAEATRVVSPHPTACEDPIQAHRQVDEVVALGRALAEGGTLP